VLNAHSHAVSIHPSLNFLDALTTDKFIVLNNIRTLLQMGWPRFITVMRQQNDYTSVMQQTANSTIWQVTLSEGNNDNKWMVGLHCIKLGHQTYNREVIDQTMLGNTL